MENKSCEEIMRALEALLGGSELQLEENQIQLASAMQVELPLTEKAVEAMLNRAAEKAQEEGIDFQAKYGEREAQIRDRVSKQRNQTNKPGELYQPGAGKEEVDR